MSNEQDKQQNPITAAALKVCTREELQQMPRTTLLSFGHLINKRLLREGAPPTIDELQGIKELVMDYLSHPAVDTLSQKLPGVPVPAMKN